VHISFRHRHLLRRLPRGLVVLDISALRRTTRAVSSRFLPSSSKLSRLVTTKKNVDGGAHEHTLTWYHCSQTAPALSRYGQSVTRACLAPHLPDGAGRHAAVKRIPIVGLGTQQMLRHPSCCCLIEFSLSCVAGRVPHSPTLGAVQDSPLMYLALISTCRMVLRSEIFAVRRPVGHSFQDDIPRLGTHDFCLELTRCELLALPPRSKCQGPDLPNPSYQPRSSHLRRVF
jgi:hypothetical protein